MNEIDPQQLELLNQLESTKRSVRAVATGRSLVLRYFTARSAAL